MPLPGFVSFFFFLDAKGFLSAFVLFFPFFSVVLFSLRIFFKLAARLSCLKRTQHPREHPTKQLGPTAPSDGGWLLSLPRRVW